MLDNRPDVPVATLGDHITPKMLAAFAMTRKGSDEDIALVSCFLAGNKTAAIAFISRIDENKVRIFPQFVFVTDEIAKALTDHDGTPPYQSEGEEP